MSLEIKDNIGTFQKYHARENIHSSNAMLMLKNVYNYSPNKFYSFLKGILDKGDNLFEPQFVAQHKEKDKLSVPDGLICQESFKILIEAKEKDNDFTESQLKAHLEYLNESCDNQYLIALAPRFSQNDNNLINELNKNYGDKIIQVTYSYICDNLKGLFDEYKDQHIYNLISEFTEYCENEDLTDDSDYKIRMRACGETLDNNVKYGIYYDGEKHSYNGFKYLGLYNDKAVRYIGKIDKIIQSNPVEDKLILTCVENYSKKGNTKVTPEEESNILEMIELSPYKDAFSKYAHNFFLVDKFVETKYQKTSPGGLFTYLRNIDIREFKLDKNASVETIADELNGKEWK